MENYADATLIPAAVAAPPAPAFEVASTPADHAMAAQQSANEAQQHLASAVAALNITKANVKEAVNTGKKIESTAGDIKKLYTKEQKPMTIEIPKGDEQGALLTRILGQLIFGVLYWFLIMKKYPSTADLKPNDESVKIQGMNELGALLHTSPANCILSWCCTGPRAAHTFHSTNVMNYWAGCVLMSCFPCLTLWLVNSFTNLNVKLGGQRRNPILGLLSACFCSCCVVAQDAESLDMIMGVETGLCGVTAKSTN